MAERVDNPTKASAGKPARAPKFRRRAEARPDEVLDAAQALFLQNGYRATTVEAIARAAGLSKGAVYLYFPSKQAVLEGLVERAVGSMPIEVASLAAQQGGSLRDVITMALRHLAQKLSQPEMLAVPRIIIHEAVAAPEIAQLYRERVLDRAVPLIAGLVAQGVERGEFRPCDPELTVRNVMGPLLVHLLLDEIFGVRPEGGLALDRLVENHITLLFDGLSKPGKEPNG